MPERPAGETRSDYGLLTDDAFVRSRQRIGIVAPARNQPHNYEVTWDGVRHFAYGYGDDNPLWCDPEYGKNTRWGGLIAPPNFVYTLGENDPEVAPLTPEQKATMKGDPFAGLGSYQAVMDFEWWLPFRPGDRCITRRTQVGVQEKRSDFGGRTAHVTNCMASRNQRGEPVVLRRGTWINAERHASAKRAEDPGRQEKNPAPEPYTQAQLDEIDACYAAETRRGAEPRYWEDVTVGEELQPKVKGPIRVSDIIVWHVGWGMQLTPPGAFRLSYLVRRKAPGLYPPNSLNIPDTVQRLHWEDERARELGIPRAYDYGGLRETFLTHALTDWMGDNAWLWKMSCQHRRFVYHGDTIWQKGRVTGKRQVDGRNEVDVEVWCENQHGMVVTPGSAVILLPARDKPVVDLPKCPADNLGALIKHEIERLNS